MRTRVFDDLRVLDLSTGMAGPLAAMIMADNGAKVVKIEPPSGEWMRGRPPFRMWNRGKESIVLDLRTSEGQASFAQLAASSDVVIESFRPGVAERLGVDFAAVERVNPRVVYASISGFGDDPALRGFKGYEAIVSALSGRLNGMDELHGAAAGQRQDRPIYQAVPVCSYAASQLALVGIAAALRVGPRQGESQHVSTSLVQGAASLVMRQGFGRSAATRPTGSKKDNVTYRGVRLTFMTAECRDGKWIQMCARQDHLFRNWLKALGLDDVLTDPRYARAPMYIESIAAVEELEIRLRERMRQRTQAEWMRLFVEEHDVGADPFLLPAEFLAHPQMVENGRTVVIEDPEVGPVTQVGPLALFSETPSMIGAPAPTLGEHNCRLESARDAGAPELIAPSQPPRSAARNGGRLPLEGVTVLELAYFLAGPIAASVLAELGARVIKIETLEGDPWRRTGLECAHVLHGKESIVLDLKAPRGTEVLHKLIAQSDVLLTSFRPQVHERLGFDYETARRINPQLVYLYASSYGSKGPWSHRAAFHSTPQALGGAGILQAGKGNPPVDDSSPDPIAGLASATAIAMALLARQRTGRGQYLETTMLCSNGYAQSEHLVLYEGAPEWEVPDFEQRGQSALRRLYECASGWLMLCVVQEDEWRALVLGIERDEWTGDPRFATSAARAKNDAELTHLVGEALRARTADDWEKHLTALDVPAVRADRQSLEEFLLAHYEMTPMKHAEYGEYWRLPPRVDFLGIPSRMRPACSVGEHTRALLAECGYDAAAIEQMIAEGVARPTILTAKPAAPAFAPATT